MPNIDKTFGATSTLRGGIIRGLDAEAWLESLTRVLDAYVNRNSSVVYDIRFSFPEADERADFIKLPQTIIHFEIDDIDNPKFGMGDNVVDEIFDETGVTVQGIEAVPHVVDIDVGIWASPNSGGTTARLRAYQLLNRLFTGAEAYENLLREGDIEIINFTGGSFIREKVSDIALFRVVGISLKVRVFERRVRAPVSFIEAVEQEQDLEISGQPIS
jgi:hypothetical protein